MMIIATALAAAFALPSPQQSPAVSLKPDVKVNQMIRFMLDAEIKLPQTIVAVRQPLAHRVLAMRADGTVVIEAIQYAGKGVVQNREVPINPDLPQKLTFLPDGRLEKIEGTKADEAAYRFGQANAVYRPNKAVRSGDRWKIAIPASRQNGDRSAEVVCTFKGAEQVDKVDCLRIDFSYRETSGTAPMSSTGTHWISAKDKWLVKSERSIKNAQGFGSPKPITISMTISRNR